MIDETYTLPAADLFDKWGFDDGDLLYDVLPRRADGMGPAGISSDLLLLAAVRRFLLPVLRPRVELIPLLTIHNPARAMTVDGSDWSERDPVPVLEPSAAIVTRAQLRDLLDELVVFLGREGISEALEDFPARAVVALHTRF